MPADEPTRSLTMDGVTVPFRPGQTVAGALIAAGRHVTRTTRIGARPRGLFCGIGGCFDCLITVNGRPNVRACLEPATAGDVVSTQRGVGTAPGGPLSSTNNPVREDVEIVVVGAGPAGLAAAVAAADAGAKVTVVDAGTAPGGQYLRRSSIDAPGIPWRHHQGPAEALGRALGHARICFLHRHLAWLTRMDGGGRPVLHAVDAADGREIELRATVAIVATGAYDRVVPFPGWDLPGVVTAGAAQALLKGQDVLVGRRVVVAGTGPFLLAVAAGLTAAGGQVAAVVEANRPCGWLRHLPAVLRAPGKVTDATRYLATLRRAGVRVLTGSAVTAVTGTAGSLHVRVDRVDREWLPRPGRPRGYDVDAVCVGFGFTPALELAIGFGCTVRTSGWDGSLVVETDQLQRTTVPGVLAAGEVTGIGGADRATAQGRIAGLAAAQAIGRLGAAAAETIAAARRTVRSEDRFAAAMHAVYRARPGWQSWLADDVLLCRCEEVAVARVRRDIRELGADDLRSLKLLSRVGMGVCQGRVCGHAAAELLRAHTSMPTDLLPVATRPIATPVPLRILAGVDTPADEEERAP